METGKAIYKLLKDSADIGAICADRIYPELAQQDADAPFIVYTIVDTSPSATKNATSKLDTARVELYCLSQDYEEAMDLGIAVRAALDRQSGTISGVQVQSIDFDTSDIQFDPDQRIYVVEHTYQVRVQRTGTAQVVSQFPGNTFTIEEVDGDPTGAVNKLVVSNGSLSIDGNTATITTGSGVDTQYHGRYDTQAETLRSGATGDVEFYYTARPDGDGTAESETSDVGETDTINRTLAYSTKHRADPDTAADWTDYTTQPADNASFATAKAALLAGLNETDATAETRGTLPVSLKMTRTTTPAQQDLLLDTYTGAAAAYSVRKLSKDYTGYCMRVRRSSDDTTQDIGFDSNGDLDTAAIASFVGDAFGYLSGWFDQSGNSRDLLQSVASAQPMIYDRVAAAVITENGKPAVKTDGNTSNMFMITSSFAGDSGPVSVFAVRNATGSSNTEGIIIDQTSVIGFSSADGFRFDCYNNLYRFGTNRSFSQSALTTPTGQELQSGVANSSGRTLYIDGSSVVTTSGDQTTTGTTREMTLLGTRHSSKLSFEGTTQEVILYTGTSNGDQSSNRTGIESDINTYFSIY